MQDASLGSKHRMKPVTISTAVLASIASIAAVSAVAQNNSRAHTEVMNAVHQDTLPSLRDVVPRPEDFKKMRARVEHDLPLPPVPDNQSDGAVQSSVNALRLGMQNAAFAPTAGSNVLGVGNGFSGPQ